LLNYVFSLEPKHVAGNKIQLRLTVCTTLLLFHFIFNTIRPIDILSENFSSHPHKYTSFRL